MSVHILVTPVRGPTRSSQAHFFSSKNIDLVLPQLEYFLDYFPSEAHPGLQAQRDSLTLGI